MMNPAPFGPKWLITHLFSAENGALMLKIGCRLRCSALKIARPAGIHEKKRLNARLCAQITASNAACLLGIAPILILHFKF